jgi:hypothetical protein
MSHALGKNGYRNRFAADPFGDDAVERNELVELRLAVRGRECGELQMFHVSTHGVAFMRSLFPRRFKRELKGVKP